MRITYDGEADALYIELKASKPKESIDIEDGVTADLDSKGHIIGLEVLGARERIGKEALAHLTVERLNGELLLRVKNVAPKTAGPEWHGNQEPSVQGGN